MYGGKDNCEMTPVPHVHFRNIPRAFSRHSPKKENTLTMDAKNKQQRVAVEKSKLTGLWKLNCFHKNP